MADHLEELREREIPQKIVAALTSVNAGDLDSAGEIMEEVKQTSDIGIDYLFGMMIGLVEAVGEMRNVDADEILQLIALRIHLQAEGVEVDDLPSLNFVGALPSENAEKLISLYETSLNRIKAASTKAVRDSSSMLTDDSEVYRGDALLSIGKAANTVLEKGKKYA